MAKYANIESQDYLFYCGRVRKIAVRTKPRALKISNSEVKDHNIDGKLRKFHSEDGFATGEIFLGSNSEITKAHQVFDEMSHKEKTEKNIIIPAKIVTNYTSAMKGTTTKMGFESNSGIDVVYERRKLLESFRKSCQYYRNQSGGCSKRIDCMAYDDLKDSGELFIIHKTFGPIPGVQVGECFDYRFELVIMGIHYHHYRGIDYTETSNGRVLATSVVATEGYGDDLMKPDELVYTGEGGGTFDGTSKGEAKDQELRAGNLAMKNSANDGNFVRVIRGIKSKRYDLKSATTFVYDGLYNVVDYAKKLGPNGKMQYKFTLKRCSGQKTISWEKFK
ncbi:histone-lysine N-methyltransferase, H3 lysine-9 specific SUVH5-like [Chenopodium quinoa]|uniref:YDG domain-containing protein n=1 Tax=Chenopodium quinoa TaxID=63459 RepID=A0A803LRF9_CHEQI|nr:histone-lysine N-methyltransferase, H3 lysine-9 specific SUVH5-like [Chenopodium quinoa]